MGGHVGGLLTIIRTLGAVNAGALAVGRWVGIACMALMVVFILVQVFWRYVLNNPLPWPEEAARFLLLLALLVLVFAVRIGWSEVTGFSGRFATSSLYYPTVDGWEKVPRSWMMASLLVGFIMLTSVAVELILRQIATLAGRDDDLPVIPETEMVGAE